MNRRRAFWLGAAALGALAPTTSFAADLPVKVAPAAPALAASWAGFYLGIHGGYGWKQNGFTEVIDVNPFATIGGINAKGAVYGAQAGYNWQYGRLVAGVELDFSATDIRGDSSLVVRNVGAATFTDLRSDKVSYLGTARGRLGWAPTDTVLLYGTAGLGWERFKRTDSNATVAPGISNTTVITTPFDRFGWVAGAGIEAKLPGTNWVGRVEYLHYGFGAVEQGFSTTTVPGGTIADQRGDQHIDVVRAAVSYKFDELTPRAAPAYAKAPVVIASAPWAGFYLGIHGGYGWKRNSFSEIVNVVPNQTVGGIDSKGGLVGGQVGYNWQYGRAVAGLELDFSASDIKGSASTLRLLAPGITDNEIRSDTVKYLGTARGRLGWTPIDNVLLYGTAGLAWERFDRESRDEIVGAGFTQQLVNIVPSDRFGWVAGAGVESLLFGTNWVGRLEYLHYDFGAVQDVSARTTLITSFAESSGHQHIDIVRAAVSYKFGEPAAAPVRPLYAKAPAVLPPGALWAGFYLGAHGGYGWAQNNFTTVFDVAPLLTFDGIKSKGAVYGGQVGHNWQYGRAVAGLELDFSVTDIKGDSNRIVSGGGTTTDFKSDDVSYLGTARGRLGWTPTDTVLLYGTAGLAWERYKRIDTTVDVTPGLIRTTTNTTPFDRFGWVAGVGVEGLLFGANWVGRLEYLHYDFGRVETFDSFTQNPGISFGDRRGSQTIDILRAGVSYKLPPT
jgi:opacity protein-like surface antigen